MEKENCEVKFTFKEIEKQRPNVFFLIFKIVFHFMGSVLGCGVLLYGVWIIYNAYDFEEVIIRDLRTVFYGFGTNWNYIFQTVFLSISLLYDVLEWLDKHHTEFGKKLQYYRDVMFNGMVVPFTMFISSMFWTVYLIDRELVFPEVYDQIVPWWFNHCVHTNIAIVVLIETILQARRHPTNKKLELTLVATIGIVYAIVYYTIYFLTKRWLYAVFGIMTWWQVCLYQLLIWGSTFVFYYIQFPINRIFHREESVELETSGGEKNGKGEFQ